MLKNTDRPQIIKGITEGNIYRKIIIILSIMLIFVVNFFIIRLDFIVNQKMIWIRLLSIILIVFSIILLSIYEDDKFKWLKKAIFTWSIYHYLTIWYGTMLIIYRILTNTIGYIFITDIFLLFITLFPIFFLLFLLFILWKNFFKYVFTKK